MFTAKAEAQLAHSQRQQSTNCIVCYNSLDGELIVSDDLSQTLKSEVKSSDLHRQELFEIFCDYMELDPDSFAFSYDSDPVQSTFPFCQVCEVMLMDLCELHDEMKHLVSRATQIKARLVGLVLESSNSKHIPSISSDTASDDTEIIRKIIAERYTTKVVIQSQADPSTIQENMRASKRKHNPGARETTINIVPELVNSSFDGTPKCDQRSFECPSADTFSEDWECASGSGGSSSEQGLEQQEDYHAPSSSTTTSTSNPVKTRSGRVVKMTKFVDSDEVTVTCSKPKEESILKHKKKSVKENGANYEKIGPNKYVYADKFPFEKNGDKYKCDICCIFKPSLAKILLHMRRSHHRLKPASKRNHKFVEIQPNKFIYGNKLAVYKIKKKFHCCTCAFKTTRRDTIIRHLRKNHLTANEDGFQGEEQRDGDSSQKNLDLESLFYPIVELTEHLNENSSGNNAEEEGVIKPTGELNEPKSDSEADDSNDTEDEMGLDQNAPQPKKKLWEEISEGKFLYRERFPFSKVGDQYFCGSPPCTNMSPTFRQIVTHVRRCHIYERTPGKARIRFTHKLVETGPGQFIYASQYPITLSEGIYTCGTCQHTSKGKYTLVEHVRSKHLNPRQDLVCETCGKVYTCPKNFCAHKRMHQNQACYVCNICGNSFAQPGYLRRHMRTSHMGDEVKKYVCEFCGKKFRTRTILIGHTSTHTGEKSFVCSHCPMVFTTYNSMVYHRVRAHGDGNGKAVNA